GLPLSLPLQRFACSWVPWTTMACHTPRDVAQMTNLAHLNTTNVDDPRSELRNLTVGLRKPPGRSARRKQPFTSTPCFPPRAAPPMLEKSAETAKAIACVRSALCRTLASPSLGKQYRFATAV